MSMGKKHVSSPGRRRGARPDFFSPPGRRADAGGGVHEARQGRSSPASSPALLPAAQQDPASFAGRVFEVPVTVCGLIAEDAQQTALVAVTDGPTLGHTCRRPCAARPGNDRKHACAP